MAAIRGSLDVVSTTAAMGWAYVPRGKDKLTVQALLNHSIIGEAIAEIHRPDLAAVGLGDGNCGFHISFYQDIDPLYLPFVVVKPEGGDVDFPRATISGYNDYFASLYRQYPVTARHRSVFGGLWIDRLDAAALLRDRIDAGLVADHVGQTLDKLVRSGFAIIDIGPRQEPAARPAAAGERGQGKSKTPDPADAVATVLRAKVVLDPLKSILDGIPIALGTHIVEGPDEGFRQASATEVLTSPGECVTLIVPLDQEPVELDVIRDSHLFPEFSAQAESRWINPSSAAAIDVALREHGMVDRHVIQSGSVAIVGPGTIHRVRTEAGVMALRIHCTPARIAPLDRLLDGVRKEIVLESGARIWM